MPLEAGTPVAAAPTEVATMYPDGRFMDHGWGWWFLGGIVPLLFFGLLIALVVWAVFHLSRTWGPAAAPPAPPAPGPRADQALEEVRIRYARGEMGREEFLERFRDLGGVHPEPVPPSAAPPPSSPSSAPPPSPPAADAE